MKVLEMRYLLALTVALAAVVPAAHGIWLELPSSGEKCLSEELHSNIVVLGDYYSFYGEVNDLNATVTPYISVKVINPYGNTLYHQENVTHGQFAFTTTETGSYEACFKEIGGHHAGEVVSIGMEWRTGIAAKDWDLVAKKEKIEGLELELKKLEDGVLDIHGKLIDLVNKEMHMRFITELTNARVAWCSITSIGICIVASSLQVWYLKRYFRKKKLI